MTASNIITVEETVKAYLQEGLPLNEHFLELGVDLADVPFYWSNNRMVKVTPHFILISCDEWNVTGNPNTMPSWMVKSKCEVVGVIRAFERDVQNLRVKHMGIALMEVLNAEKYLIDSTTGTEIYGYVSSLRVADVDIEGAVEDNREMVFRGCQAMYSFDIPHNV